MNTISQDLVNFHSQAQQARCAHQRMESDMSTVLILGASGRFGRNAAEAFAMAGWQVRRFKRGGDLTQAAQGADVIVNAWNPPYNRWAAEIPGLTRQVIAAAKASGASVMIPGNVYVYGKDAPQRFAPDTPHRAENPLGKIRREMEAAYKASGVQTIVLRAGDFIDTDASGNWFDQIIAAKASKGLLRYPGALDTPHAWAFLPDVARAAVQVAERRSELGAFTDLCFEGYTLTARQLSDAVSTAIGPVQLRRMSWLPIQIARPFWPLARGILEMRYLWSKPHHLDGSALRAVVPDLPETPLAEAMRQALAFQVHPDEAMARAAA